MDDRPTDTFCFFAPLVVSIHSKTCVRFRTQVVEWNGMGNRVGAALIEEAFFIKFVLSIAANFSPMPLLGRAYDGRTILRLGKPVNNNTVVISENNAHSVPSGRAN
jgi:hypothetical protein